jgi:hypothetical protein
MLDGALGKGRIAVWYRSLSPEERSAHARKAGRQRWNHAGAFDHLRVRHQLQKYRLSKGIALERLARANAQRVLQQNSAAHVFSKMPIL